MIVREPALYDTITRIKVGMAAGQTPGVGAPSTWEEAAQQILNELAWQNGWHLDHMRTEDIEGYYEIGRWDVLARACLADILSETEMDTTDLVGFLAGKQNDYGPRNILMFGFEGLKVRLWDKVARLVNLADRDTIKNESLVDTKIDIVGYVVITLMLEFGWFELPLEADLT